MSASSWVKNPLNPLLRQARSPLTFHEISFKIWPSFGFDGLCRGAAHSRPALCSSRRSSETMGQISIPAKKLPAAWTASQGRPAMIQAIIP